MPDHQLRVAPFDLAGYSNAKCPTPQVILPELSHPATHQAKIQDTATHNLQQAPETPLDLNRVDTQAALGSPTGPPEEEAEAEVRAAGATCCRPG